MTARTPETHIRAAHKLLAQMAARSHVAPKRLVEPGPTDEELQLIFKAAESAPNHGRIRSWRFVTVSIEKRVDLGDAFVDALVSRDPLAEKDQIAAAHDKALRAPCLLLAVVSDEPSDPHIPKSERLLSMGCAIQNMLLMAHTLAIGSGITSGQAMNDKAIRTLFGLETYEEAICFLNFGTTLSLKPARLRPAYSSFVSTF